MENAVMLGVLLAVMGIGLFGLYFVNAEEPAGTIYIPRVTGLGFTPVSEATVTAIDSITVKLDTGLSSATHSNIQIQYSQDAVIPTKFDTFGNCNGCDSYNVTTAPTDNSYGGASSTGTTLCAILNTDSNTDVNVSIRLNASLPTGFTAEKVTLAPYATNTTPAGTDDTYARDMWVNESFHEAAALTLTTSFQQILGFWDDGTGVGNSNKYDVACQWTVNPAQTPSGVYLLKRDFLGSSA